MNALDGRGRKRTNATVSRDSSILGSDVDNPQESLFQVGMRVYVVDLPDYHNHMCLLLERFPEYGQWSAQLHDATLTVHEKNLSLQRVKRKKPKKESKSNEITVYSKDEREVKKQKKKKKKRKKKKSEGCCPSCEKILTISFFTACFLRFCSILLSFLIFLFVMMFAQSRFSVLQFWILIGFSACVLAFQVAKLIESCSASIVPEEEFLLDILWKQQPVRIVWFQVRNDVSCCCGDDSETSICFPYNFVTSILFILAIPLLFPWDVAHDVSEGCPRMFSS